MDGDETARAPQPTDTRDDGISRAESGETGPTVEDDTEGHSMLTVDLAWTIARERVREG